MTTELDTTGNDRERTYTVSFSGTVTVTVDESIYDVNGDATDEDFEWAALEIAEGELSNLTDHHYANCYVGDAELVFGSGGPRPQQLTPSASAKGRRPPGCGSGPGGGAMSVHHVTDADFDRRALEHACPDCGAKAGVRCRILTPGGWSGKGRTKVDVRRKPCVGRVQVAWRAWLAEGEAADRG